MTWKIWLGFAVACAIRLDGTTAVTVLLAAAAVVEPARTEVRSANAVTRTTVKLFRLVPFPSGPDQVTLSRSVPLEVPSLRIVGIPFAVSSGVAADHVPSPRPVKLARGLCQSQDMHRPPPRPPPERGNGAPRTRGFLPAT